MFKRVALFLATNLAVLLVFSVVMAVFGLDPRGNAGLLIMAALFGFGGSIISLLTSKWIAKKTTGAYVIEQPRNEPERWLVETVRRQAQAAGIGMPEVGIFDSPQPNAFATGRSPSRAAVAVSTGLMETLNRDELAGVIAHELAHIKNRDTLTMAVAATIGGAVSMFAQYLQIGAIFGSGRSDERGGMGMIGTLAAMILAPLAAMLVQMSISRSREYAADRMGAMIVGNPLWLASALQKINAKARQIINKPAEAVPAAAHMFIINPLNGRGIDSMFSTHPNVDNRIAELEALAREMGVSGTLADSSDLTPPDEGNTDTASAPRDVWIAGQSHGRTRRPWG